MTKEGILKHKEVFDAWLSGAKVQYYGEKTKKWIDINNPSWELIIKYRIKPTRIEFEDCVFYKTEYIIAPNGKVETLDVDSMDYSDASKIQHRLFKDKKIAEAYAVLPKLIRLVDEYNEGWKPDYKDRDCKYYVGCYEGNLELFVNSYTQRILVFKTEEIRDKFLNEYRDLIEIAKPLL